MYQALCGKRNSRPTRVFARRKILANDAVVLSFFVCKLNSLFTFLKVLAQGSSPLAYLSDHISKYVACVKDKAKEGCDVILNPPKKTEAKKRTTAARWPKQPKPIVHYI